MTLNAPNCLRAASTLWGQCSIVVVPNLELHPRGVSQLGIKTPPSARISGIYPGSGAYIGALGNFATCPLGSHKKPGLGFNCRC